MSSEPLSSTPPHDCGHCIHTPTGIYHVNVHAPFYPLVEQITRMWGELGRMGAGRRTNRLHEKRH